MTRRLHTAAAVVLGTLVLAPAASAAQLPPAVQEVFRDFSRDGIVSPCKHTVDDLRETRASIPPDIDQYAPDFPEAVRAALEAHARGACSDEEAAGGEAGGGAAPGAAAGTPGSTATGSQASPAVVAAPGTPTKTVASEPPAPDAGEEASAGVATPELTRVAARTASSDAPAPVWIVAGGAALLALVALATLLAGRTRRGAEGLDHLRHSWGEAAWRASATWTDFREWVRTGR